MSDQKMPEKNAKKGESARTEHADLSDSCFSKSVCSAMDCTGLIPALPSSEEELEAYEEMYSFCPGDAAQKSPTADHASH